MVRRAFGAAAGLLAGLLLAITPIFVVMNRDNNPDSLMVFALILATWAILRAAEFGKLRWLALAGGLVGSMTSGEGLVNRLSGQGEIYLQSRSIDGLVRFLRTKLR